MNLQLCTRYTTSVLKIKTSGGNKQTSTQTILVKLVHTLDSFQQLLPSPRAITTHDTQLLFVSASTVFLSLE